jgi:hypothetical protein
MPGHRELPVRDRGESQGVLESHELGGVSVENLLEFV